MRFRRFFSFCARFLRKLLTRHAEQPAKDKDQVSANPEEEHFQSGTGLGLAIALGVARAHGGTIELVSEPGQGAEFVMTLPVASAERERDENV